MWHVYWNNSLMKSWVLKIYFYLCRSQRNCIGRVLRSRKTALDRDHSIDSSSSYIGPGVTSHLQPPRGISRRWGANGPGYSWLRSKHTVIQAVDGAWSHSGKYELSVMHWYSMEENSRVSSIGSLYYLDWDLGDGHPSRPRTVDARSLVSAISSSELPGYIYLPKEDNSKLCWVDYG